MLSHSLNSKWPTVAFQSFPDLYNIFSTYPPLPPRSPLWSFRSRKAIFLVFLVCFNYFNSKGWCFLNNSTRCSSLLFPASPSHRVRKKICLGCFLIDDITRSQWRLQRLQLLIYCTHIFHFAQNSRQNFSCQFMSTR